MRSPGKYITKLKARLVAGERPPLPHTLWSGLRRIGHCNQEDHDFENLRRLGLATKTRRLTKLGEWYLRTTNALKVVDGNTV